MNNPSPLTPVRWRRSAFTPELGLAATSLALPSPSGPCPFGGGPPFGELAGIDAHAARLLVVVGLGVFDAEDVPACLLDVVQDPVPVSRRHQMPRISYRTSLAVCGQSG